MSQPTQMTEELDDCFVKTAGNIVKFYVDEEDRKKILGELRETLKQNCVESAKIKTADEIRKRLERVSELEPEKKVVDIIKDYKKAIFEIEVDPLKDKRLMEYDSQINGLLQANESTPSNGLDDTDIDLRLTGRDINVIDPISKTRMTNPVRNAVCGHVYDKASLVAMLKKNKNTRCPVVGCTSMGYIVLSQCRTDIVMKMYLEENSV